MRAWGGIAVVGALLVAAPGVSGASEPVAVTFTYSGGAESFTVPAHVHQVTIEACGAAGGSSESVLNGVTTPGGVGGWARRVVPVSPGEVLRVRVGGTPPTPHTPLVAPGGFNGGGVGENLAGGGGGASDVRQGGDGLADRIVVGGGGGGAGQIFPFGPTVRWDGGDGGGTTGESINPYVTGGTQTGGGVSSLVSGRDGSLGAGGGVATEPAAGGGGGGGGLYGGAAGPSLDFGSNNPITGPNPYIGPGAGGSGFGSEVATGTCAGGASVTITAHPRSILPYGVLATEGDGGSEVVLVPVYLSEASDTPVSVDWTTDDLPDTAGYAQPGEDFVAASGTVTFAPGETTAHVPIELIDDDVDEPHVLWGEWGTVRFSNPHGAALDTSVFFGAGLFIIIDDD